MHLRLRRRRPSPPTQDVLTRVSHRGSQIGDEGLKLGEGFDKSESLPIIQGIKTLKRLTLTNCKNTTDDDLKLLARMKQLETLELGGLPLADERITQLHGFAFLKELKLINRPKGHPEDLQAKIKALLPKVTVKFQ